jgi:hypothetical protein
VRDVEFGKPLVGCDLFVALRISEGVALVLFVGTGGFLVVRLVETKREGLGVVLESPVGSRTLLCWFCGVFRIVLGAALTEVSEIGGEGGVGVSDTVSAVPTDLVSGGVVIKGEEATDSGEWSNGESGDVISVVREGSVRVLCFLSLSCMISASILRSESSSRSRCVSIRSPSLSCSPILISSSIITALSIPMLNFDSKSSSDEVVFRACLSKSSFVTSISRSFSCSVLLVSRNVVISCCRVFCAAFASAFACLYFV